MSDDIFTSSDESDTFIDQFFEELGSVVPTEDQKSPSVESQNSSQLTDIDLQSNQSSGSFPQPPNSDASEPQLNTKGLLSEASSDSIHKISSIFLTEGEKNRRILRQDQAISKALEDEEVKTAARITSLEKEKKKILQELNDNGSSYIFNWRNDSKIIEDYVHKSLTGNYFMITSRHFYFFDDIEKPKNDGSDIIDMKHIFKALEFGVESSAFLESLRLSSIPLIALLRTSLSSVYNVALLESLENIFRYAYSNPYVNSMESENGADTPTSISIRERDNSFLYMMKIIGASTIAASGEFTVSLKLKHYNTHAKLVISRLSMIYHFFLPRAKSREEFVQMLECFYLSCSDFHLNKQEKDRLRKRFIGPIFRVFVKEWIRQFDQNSFVNEAHRIFVSVNPALFGETEPQMQKTFEIHFNLLINLLNSVSSDQSSLDIAKKLAHKFLGYRESVPELQNLARVTETVSKIGFASTSDVVMKYKNEVHKNFFKVHLISRLLSIRILTETTDEEQSLSRCYEKLQDCKDAYQSIIGQISFSTEEDKREKSLVITILSETYHVLNELVNAMQKSGVLPDRDFFYDIKN